MALPADASQYAPMSTTTLIKAPRLSSLYAGAVLTARGRKGARGPLPRREVIQPEARVDRDQLAAYDRVCGFGLRDELPATFLHVLVFPLQLTLMVDREFPFALPGLVHVRNAIVQHRPVRADEVLQLRSTTGALRAHPKGAQIDLIGEARVGDDLVWEGRSTYLAKGARVPEDTAQAPDRLTVDLPDGPPQAIWAVPRDMGRRYAAVSGDVNPMHLSPLAAKAFGFPRMLVHGMWTKARTLAALGPHLSDAYAVDVAFSKPLLLPSTVDFVAASRGGGWDLAVRPHHREGDHLRARLRPL